MPPKHTVMREDLSLVNTRTYGSMRDATTLGLALTAISTAQRFLFLHDEDDGIWTLSSTVTIPANVTLLIPPGVTVTGAGNLAIQGGLLAAREDWYQGSGTLTISHKGLQTAGLTAQALNLPGSLYFPNDATNAPFATITPSGGVLTLPADGVYFAVNGTQTLTRLVPTNNATRLVMLLLTGGGITTGADATNNLRLIGPNITVNAPDRVLVAFLANALEPSNGTTWLELWRVTPTAGQAGPPGPAGTAATLAIGTVFTVSYGVPASANNVGTPTAAILDLAIPQGAPDNDGNDGVAATIAVGIVSTGAPGSSASVTNVGSSSAAVLDFAIPKASLGRMAPTGLQARVSTPPEPTSFPQRARREALETIAGERSILRSRRPG